LELTPTLALTPPRDALGERDDLGFWLRLRWRH
jgi:hypothetical protein